MDDPARSPVLVLVVSLMGMLAVISVAGTIWGAKQNNVIFLVGICGFLLSIVLMLSLPLLLKLRFSLRTLLLSVIAAGTCVSMILAESLELKSIGIVGALLVLAATISAVARAGDDANRQDDW